MKNFEADMNEANAEMKDDFEPTTNEERVFISEILNAASIVLWHSGQRPTSVLVAPDRWPSSIMVGAIRVFGGINVERSRLVKPGTLACIRAATVMKIERTSTKTEERSTAEVDGLAMTERLEAAERERDALVAKLVEIFGWEDPSFLHAILHVENAVGALRSDCVVMAEREKRNESVLAERWRHLLLAESRLQYQRSLILDSTGLTIESIRRIVLEDANRRPSPDFRSLLLNTRKQLVTIRNLLASSDVRVALGGHVLSAPVTTEERNTAFVGALKEALRLTDVERLPIEDASGAAALREVVNATIVKLQTEVERVGEEIYSTAGLHADNPALESLSLLRHTIVHILNDLEAARDNPLEYIATRTMKATGEAVYYTTRSEEDPSP